MIMEKKYIKVPFDVEMAKKITEKSVEGRIVTRCGFTARVICWDRFGRDNPLVVLFNNKKDEVVVCYNNDGVFSTEKKENSLDLMLEIPEYMAFKDGDIVKLSNDTYTWLSIIKDIDLSDDGKGGLLYFTNDYVSMLINDGDGSIDIDTYSDAGQKVERATEEEKQKLIDVMKANESPKAKEYLKRFFGIEEKKEYEFKPFDKVLVRDNDFMDGVWYADIFSHISTEGNYCCIGSVWEYCIPYNEQTAHLLGTTNNL
ncbi:hypothetical protein [uncultured Bacteroides sp.]|uniref:hypothetical protein n=1 Tax=uncultured Bacteroides sp. TaxID=162156 RepID=UPI002597541D|nr:hypothetical protein [uncultured Bacteroides sp.]